VQKQTKKFKDKENTTDHSIRSKWISNDYSTILSIWGNI